MSDNSKIEWTDASWTPIRARLKADPARKGWHCEHVSEGCRNCYAETFNRRGLGTGLDYKPGNRKSIDLFLDEAMLAQPLRWKRPRRIFVCSMTDLFADFVPDEWIDRMFAVMAISGRSGTSPRGEGHVFQVLTKRPDRMLAYLTDPKRSAFIAHEANKLLRDRGSASRFVSHGLLPLPNVWLGVSVEDQARADERIPALLAAAAAVRFLSCEPMLGRVDLCEHLGIWWNCTTGRWVQARPSPLHWIIAGGESGPGARPMHPDWARSLRDQCAAAPSTGSGQGVPFFFKQWGAWLPAGQVAAQTGLWSPRCGSPLLTTKKNAGRLLDGVEHSEMPAVPA